MTMMPKSLIFDPKPRGMPLRISFPLYKVLIFILLPVLFGACSTERRLANRFVKQSQEISVVVLFPQEVFAINEKSPDQKGSFSLRLAESDTGLVSNTLILKEIKEKEVIQLFAESFTNELGNYKIQVYKEAQMDDFLQLQQNAFMLNLAQLEVQEYLTVFTDEIGVGERTYTADVYLNVFNLGVWIELNALNDTRRENSSVLFATHDLTDRFNGYFVQRFFTGEIDYKLTQDTITVQQARNFVSYLGRLYAAYTFDYLMNSYVQKNSSVPEGVNRKYFRYDPYRKMLFPTETDKFTVLE